MSKAKLHELLAVKPTKEGEVDALMKDHAKKFASDHHLFKKVEKVFTPASEKEGEAPKAVVEESTKLVTTVAKEADFVLSKFTECLDLLYTIDAANCEAVADIVCNGAVFAEAVPATFLVHLEKRLNQVIKLIESMATADPAIDFTLDPSLGPNVLKSTLTRPRTAKLEEWITIVEATKEHPAQAKLVTRDIVTGMVVTHNWVSLPTVNQKSQLFERAVALKNAVVEARARANCLEIEQKKIFGKMKDFILRPLNS